MKEMDEFRKPVYARFALLGLMILGLCTACDAAADSKKSLGPGTIVPPCPVWVIGSYDAEGVPNMMTASWVGICCSDPPSVTVSLRSSRHSYGNIIGSKAFTVNIPSKEYARETAFFGSVSGKNVDKLAATGLTATSSGLVNAPYLAEFPLVVECKLVKTVEIGSHTMLIGEIIDVKANEDILGKGGLPDPEKLGTFLFMPGNGDFYGSGGSIGSIRDLQAEVGR
jgi:flavin reductase (DIM6/NTAB) family NADH-FMN oxidoreductase RutF